ncbi:MAG: peptidylprolyl isomerase [Myxococcota bacterium]
MGSSEVRGIHMSLRRRIAHFLGIGALLFAFDRFVLRDAFEAAKEPLVVSDATLARLRARWVRATGRLPTRAEWDRVIDAEVDDELLLREARRRGFHRSDALVRRRLARNIGFASARSADADARVSEALELGLDKTDLVVRRRLIQKMKLLAFDPGIPSDNELSQYLLRHVDRFERGERVDLQHIFFSRDRRDDPDRDAAAALEELDPTISDRRPTLGDAFIHGDQTGPISKADLSMRFGDGFAAAVFEVEPGGWHGPIESSFGSHLVWVHSRRAARVPPLEVVRAEVTEALLLERSQAALRELLDGLRRGMAGRVVHR